MIQCQTTDQFIAPFLQRHWGGQLFIRPRTKYNPKWKDALCWNLTGFDSILGFLREIRPYLLVKAGYADAVIAYCESRKVNARKSRERRGYTQNEIRLVESTRVNAAAVKVS